MEEDVIRRTENSLSQVWTPTASDRSFSCFGDSWFLEQTADLRLKKIVYYESENKLSKLTPTNVCNEGTNTNPIFSSVAYPVYLGCSQT
jgi:hypothetical protein